jgi:hypothetical protein
MQRNNRYKKKVRPPVLPVCHSNRLNRATPHRKHDKTTHQRALPPKIGHATKLDAAKRFEQALYGDHTVGTNKYFREKEKHILFHNQGAICHHVLDMCVSVDGEENATVRTIPHKENQQLQCYVCSMAHFHHRHSPRQSLHRRTNSQTTMGCKQCGKGFHLECFAYYHSPLSCVKSSRPELTDELYKILWQYGPHSRPSTSGGAVHTSGWWETVAHWERLEARKAMKMIAQEQSDDASSSCSTSTSCSNSNKSM